MKLITCLTLCALAFHSHSAELSGDVFIVTKGKDVKKLALTEIRLFRAEPVKRHIATRRMEGKEVIAYFEPLKAPSDKLLELTAEASRRSYVSVANPTPVPPRPVGTKRGTALDERPESPVPSMDPYPTMESIVASVAGERAAQKKQDDAIELASKNLAKVKEQNSHIHGWADYPLTAGWYFEGLGVALKTTKADADGKFKFEAPDGEYVLIAIGDRSVPDDYEVYYWLVPVTIGSDRQMVHLTNDNTTDNGGESLVRTIQSGDALLAMENRDPSWLLGFVRAKNRETELNQYRRNPKLAQSKAAELYPDLAKAASILNVEFIARYKRYQVENQTFFAEPDWPIRLARECAESLPQNTAQAGQ